MTNLEKLQKLQINTSKVGARSGLRVNKLLVVGLFILTILSLLPEIALAAKVGIDTVAKVATDPVIQDCSREENKPWIWVVLLLCATSFMRGGGDLRERGVRSGITFFLIVCFTAFITEVIVKPNQEKIQKKKIIEWQEQKSQLKEDPTPEISES